MKRRSFLAALFALPFAAKLREEPIGFSISEDVDWLEPRLGLLYRNHKERIQANTEAVRQLTEALRLNAPTGWKVSHARFSEADLKAFARSLKRIKKASG